MNKNKNLILIALILIILGAISLFLEKNSAIISEENLKNDSNNNFENVETGTTSVGSKKQNDISQANNETDINMLQLLKSSEPKDFFCSLVVPDLRFDYNLLFIDSLANGDYDKYNIGNPISVFVTCPMENGDKTIYFSFDKTRDNVVIKTYDQYGNFLQNISDFENAIYDGRDISSIFSLEYDINFDGYNDIKIINNIGANNIVISFWAFDPNTKLFIPRYDLQHLYVGENPLNLFNKDSRTIKTFRHISAAEGETSELKYINGEYVTVRTETVIRANMDYNSPEFIKVIKELKDGVMATTSVEKLSY